MKTVIRFCLLLTLVAPMPVMSRAQMINNQTSNAQIVKVMSSGGLAAAFKLLSPEFEKATGTRVEAAWGPSMGTTPGAIPVRLAKGEEGDVVLMVKAALDDLVKKGLVIEGSEVDLARSRIGMAVKAGAPVPEISTVDAFRKTLLNARSVAYSDSASGVYIETQMWKKLGIEKEMVGKSKQIPADPVGGVVASGQYELGFQQLSELKPVPGITIVGPIPDAVQQITVFSAGIVAKAPHPEAARALLHFLESKDACAAIRQTLLDPIACESDAKGPGGSSR